jgi:hypothetical protein
MKSLVTLSVFFLFALNSFSQNKPEDIFKNPLEKERESGNPVFKKIPPYESHDASVFFNINVSQQSAPQNEPSVCISRKTPNRVLAAWRDFRFGVDPVANRRVGYSYSTNAGLTWAISKLLDSTLIPGFTRNSDPVVTVDTAGNFYISVITITFPTGDLALAVYKSTDGGVTFPFATICAQGMTEDKEWITSDLTPSSPFVNNVYISWTRFVPNTGIKLTKSTNGGINWSAPVNVSENPNGVQGSQLCVSRNGQINVCWFGFTTNASIQFDRSTDGGLTFGSDVTITTGPFPEGLPNDVSTFPSIAVDNGTGTRSGWLYVVFADNRNGDCDVFFSRSTNNGANWSTPSRVNNDPMSNNKIQYWPTVAVNEAGNIAIIFMDSRNTTDNTIVEAFVARSLDGGVTFTNELVSSEPTPTNIPGGNVRFGDYIDVDYVGQNVIPVWTDERSGGFNMDIFTSEITEILSNDPVTGVPNKYELLQNYPNPFNPTTTIRFALPEASFVTIDIYNTMGQLVKSIANGSYPIGNHSVNFNAGNLSSGVYFYKLTADSFTETKKMMLIK